MPKMLTFDFVKEHIEDGGYTILSDRYDGAGDSIILICPKGHYWKTTWNIWKSGSRCPICYNMDRYRKSYNLYKKEYEKLGYTLLTPLEDYKGYVSEVKVKCSNNHVFKTRPRYLSDYHGEICKKCNRVKRPYIRHKKDIDSISDFAKKRGYVFIKDSYKDYKNSQSRIKFMCPAGHIFTTTWNVFQSGKHGCPKCGSSQNENLIRHILKGILPLTVEFEEQYPLRSDGHTYNFDFYIPKIRMAIEMDGEFHFEDACPESLKSAFAKTHKRDLAKNYYCLTNNINLIRFNYWETDSFIHHYLYKILSSYFSIPVRHKTIDYAKARLDSNRGINIQEVAQYYHDHSLKETKEHFDIAKNSVETYYEAVYGERKLDTISCDPKEVAEYYLYHDMKSTMKKFGLAMGSVNRMFQNTFGERKSQYRIKVIAAYYMNHSIEDTMKKFSICEARVRQLFSQVYGEGKRYYFYHHQKSC